MATEGIAGTKRNIRSGLGLRYAFEEQMQPIAEPEESIKPMTTEFNLDKDKIALSAQRNYDWEELADYLDVPLSEVLALRDHPEFKRAQARGRRLRKDKIYDGFNALVTEKHPRMIELGAKCDLGMNPTHKVEADVVTAELTPEEKQARLAAILAKAQK